MNIKLKQAASLAERAGWELTYFDDHEIRVATSALNRRDLTRKYFELAQAVQDTCRPVVGMQLIKDEHYQTVVQFREKEDT
jgi:hypothetical protein